MTQTIRTANVTKYVADDGTLLVSVHHRHDNLRWQVTDFTGDAVWTGSYLLRTTAEMVAERRLS